MRNHLVYDLPVRLFHWVFAGLFATAYVIASTAEDSPLFPWHMLAGLTLVLAVVARVMWGLVGTRHSRFSSFLLNPADLFRYLKGLFSGGNAAVAGHNPASSWVAVVLMLLALGLGATGYLMTSSGDPESYEEIHELLANTFLVVVILHIGGIILHSLRHRDGFALSMVDGRKQGVAAADAIQGSRPGIGALFLVIVAVFAVHAVRNYDAGSQSLNLFGATLQLGEQEGREAGGKSEAGDHEGGDHDEDE
jgi:cytochrome b